MMTDFETRAAGRRRVLLVLSLALSASGCNCGRHSLQTLSGDALFDPSPVTFGTVPLGQATKKQVSIKNIGTAALSIPQLSLSGPNAADFALDKPFAGTSLQLGEALTVTVVFTPSDVGPRQGLLSIGNATSQALSVQLSGTGVDIQLCPNPQNVDFGPTQVAGTPASQQVTFTNCGRSPADLSIGAIEGPQFADFNFSGASAATLQPGDVFTLTLLYSPNQLGPSVADLPYTACASCSPGTINLTGVGIDGALSLTPTPITFGVVAAGMTQSIAITASNPGTEPISIVSLTTQSGGPPFTVQGAPGLPASVAPGGTISFSVQFAPSNGLAALDSLVATWTVADPAIPARETIDPISGNAMVGPCQLVPPASATFGYVAANTTRISNLNFKNLGGQDCVLSSIALSAATDPYFSLVSPPATLTVPTGGTAALQVAFSPTAVMAPYTRRGALDFAVNDPNAPNGVVPLVASIQNSIYVGAWPKWHRDNGNTGLSDANTAATTNTVQWKVKIGLPQSGSGFGGRGAATYIHGPALAADDTVYQLGGDGGLFAINPSNGAILWSAPVTPPESEAQEATPTLTDAGIYLMTGGEQRNLPQFYQFSTSGQMLWSYQNSDDGYDSCPGLGYDGTLYTVDDDSQTVVAWKNNAMFWTGSLGCGTARCHLESYSGALGPDGTSYWSGQGFAMAVGPTGTAIWPAVNLAGSTQVAGNNKASPAFDGANLYVTTTLATTSTTVTGYLYNLNPANGMTVWQYATPPITKSTTAMDFGMSSPALAPDGTVVLGFADGVYGISPAGTISWKVPVAAGVLSSAAVGADGTAFIGTVDGRLLAIDTSAGAIKWSFTTGGPVNGPPAIGTDGTVYFPSDDGYLYALR